LRRTDKEITDRQLIDRVIGACQVCRLGLAQDNVPYIVPVSFGYDGSALYFHTALSGRKLEFIAANPGVCFELEQGVTLMPHADSPCNWTFSYQCVTGYGTVSELVDTEEKNDGLLKIMRQYAPGEWTFSPERLEAIRVWKIEIESISGKQSRDKFQL
jgi:nitroimidazol reductase NimA-like FMN-containing flavoprotein (pyridoxamine 5'-phosphate oxidase superfamily)